MIWLKAAMTPTLVALALVLVVLFGTPEVVAFCSGVAAGIALAAWDQ